MIEVTPMMLKAAWSVTKQFWPRSVVEMRPCKACGQVKGYRVAETSHQLAEPLPGFRETIEAALRAALAVSCKEPGAMLGAAEPVHGDKQ